jgi:hypothetical protein
VKRRSAILIACLVITLLAYAPICYALFRRVMFVFCHPICIHDHGRPVPPSDLLGLPPLIRTIDVWGYVVPVYWIALLWSVLPGTWLVLQIFYWLRRIERESRGLCVECGARLRSYRGCCPGCGTRIGPGLPPRRYVLNMPR